MYPDHDLVRLAESHPRKDTRVCAHIASAALNVLSHSASITLSIVIFRVCRVISKLPTVVPIERLLSLSTLLAVELLGQRMYRYRAKQ